MSAISIYDLARDRWNASADRYNQWEDLGESEKREAIDLVFAEFSDSKLANGSPTEGLADWQVALNQAVRKILEHPQGVVCKHWLLAKVLSALEDVGYPQPDDFVKAVVKADDFTALKFENIFDMSSENADELNSGDHDPTSDHEETENMGPRF